MATGKKRLSISMSDEMDQKIFELKKTDKYCRYSYAEIVRLLVQRGLEQQEKMESA